MAEFEIPPKPTKEDYEAQARINRWSAYTQLLVCKHEELTSEFGREIICANCRRPVSMLSDVQIARLKNEVSS